MIAICPRTKRQGKNILDVSHPVMTVVKKAAKMSLCLFGGVRYDDQCALTVYVCSVPLSVHSTVWLIKRI